MRGCMGAAKEMIYGTFFLVRFKSKIRGGFVYRNKRKDPV